LNTAVGTRVGKPVIVAIGLTIIAGTTGVWFFRTEPVARSTTPADGFQAALDQVRQGQGLADAFKLSRTLARTPGFAQHGSLLQGAVELKNGELHRAFATLNRLTPPKEFEPEARVLMGECLYRLGRLSEAVVCLQPLFENSRVAADAHRWLAAIQYDLGNNTESLRHLDQVIQLDPLDFRPHLLAGRMHADFKQHQQAIEDYSQALQKAAGSPERSAIAAKLAAQWIEAEDFQAALRTLNGVPETAEVLAVSAKASWALGERESAEQAATRALSLDPDQEEALLVLAEARRAAGRPGEAVALLERLVARRPTHYEGRYRLSVAYRENGQVDAARKTFDEVQQLNGLLDRLNVLNNHLLRDPDNIPVRREIADLWRKLGNERMAAVWDKAANEAEKIITNR